jgi:hypothetical protein
MEDRQEGATHDDKRVCFTVEWCKNTHQHTHTQTHKHTHTHTQTQTHTDTHTHTRAPAHTAPARASERGSSLLWSPLSTPRHAPAWTISQRPPSRNWWQVRTHARQNERLVSTVACTRLSQTHVPSGPVIRWHAVLGPQSCIGLQLVYAVLDAAALDEHLNQVTRVRACARVRAWVSGCACACDRFTAILPTHAGVIGGAALCYSIYISVQNC